MLVDGWMLTWLGNSSFTIDGWHYCHSFRYAYRPKRGSVKNIFYWAHTTCAAHQMRGSVSMELDWFTSEQGQAKSNVAQGKIFSPLVRVGRVPRSRFRHTVRRPTQFVCPNKDTICPNSDKIYLTIVTFLFLLRFNEKRDSSFPSGLWIVLFWLPAETLSLKRLLVIRPQFDDVDGLW